VRNMQVARTNARHAREPARQPRRLPAYQKSQSRHATPTSVASRQSERRSRRLFECSVMPVDRMRTRRLQTFAAKKNGQKGRIGREMLYVAPEKEERSAVRPVEDDT